ncbi:PQQ-dependent sugar dehydrogenase [Niabella ginsengisoli]|uniref:PQQ-dependent sugar dehydrogenase n=1 Tax=Niabella ginsengisoli TaxID=522298 RepID=A0ABS9SNH4_9BACT|nr:PQQ-dependent sugar dehydrogenase [Niabella ginsengisoli]MCH5599927.1 PQQ-dependent sugar dehydrogenase [Niabella ginsengisoli]
MLSKLFFALSTVALISFNSCNPGDNAAPEPDPETPGLPPVDTTKPNTKYNPAFEGQTRGPGMKTTTALDIKVLSEGLVNPWGIAAMPDGRFLITEKGGTMRIAKTSGELSSPIIGLPAVNSNGQGGLLGVTLDPGFANTRMAYWVFSENIDGGTLTAVAKGRLSDDETKIENPTVIYRATPAFNGTLHYGGRILFGKDGNLFVSTGERSNTETRPKAQDLGTGLGKIVHITKEGRPVAGNPFEGTAGAMPENYSYGHRNVQGLALHPETGDLWENEFGPFGGDEVNRIEASKNYGWPTITYGLEYSKDSINNGLTQKEGLEQPVYYWDPVVSPSGMTFYSGDLIPEWKNNLFIGCLSGSHIARLKIDNNNKVVGEERLLADQQQRFRDIVQGKDGALYAICDGAHGRLYRIGKK